MGMDITRHRLLRGLLLLCGASILIMLYSRRAPLELFQKSHTFMEKLWKHEPENTTLLDPDKQAQLELRQNSHTFVKKLCKPELKNATLWDPYKQPCMMPSLDPWDPSIRRLVKTYPPLLCKGPPILVYREGELLKVDENKVIQLKVPIHHCIYKTHVIIAGTDLNTRHVFTSKPFTGSIKLRTNDTDIVVECFDELSKLITKSFHSFIFPKPNVEAERRRHLKEHFRRNGIAEAPNVLLIGMDGMSLSNFIRKMPKTRQYLMKDLKAIELKKHNTLGGYTFANIMPLLTGRHPKYYPKKTSIYGKWGKHRTLDQLNKAFIWNDFEQAGYRTGFAWERTTETAFHYNTKGWRKRYVDYTNRATTVRKLKEPRDSVQFLTKKEMCINDMTDIQMVTGYLKELAAAFNSTETPYFGFTFLIRLTHDDPELASGGDQTYLAVLEDFKDLGLLHNTVLIFFSDHGGRFGAVRQTKIGSMEVSLPITYLAFPEWFRKKYPEAIKHLLANSDRLTTHYDTYETIKDLLFFGSKTEQPIISKYGISLLRKHPEKRSCWDAGIPLENCVCLDFKKIHADSTIIQYMGQVAVNYINNAVWSFRSVCQRVKLSNVTFVYRLGADRDNGLMRYRFSIHTNPNDAVYEVTMQCLPEKTKRSGDPKIISAIRVNLYGNQAACVKNRVIKNFCQCL